MPSSPWAVAGPGAKPASPLLRWPWTWWIRGPTYYQTTSWSWYTMTVWWVTQKLHCYFIHSIDSVFPILWCMLIRIRVALICHEFESGSRIERTWTNFLMRHSCFFSSLSTLTTADTMIRPFYYGLINIYNYMFYNYTYEPLVNKL